MDVVETIAEYRKARAALKGSVGFWPTLGFIHAGHLSIGDAARKENDNVVVSIFVNPTQFGPNEDFKTYPRDLDRDLGMLRDQGTDIVFTPSVEEMYPEGMSTFVDVGPITELLEGASRPGHFRGVAT